VRPATRRFLAVPAFALVDRHAPDALASYLDKGASHYPTDSTTTAP